MSYIYIYIYDISNLRVKLFLFFRKDSRKRVLKEIETFLEA